MYTSIAPFYDRIFPFQETTYKFLDKYLHPGIVLDIACGTGTYTHALHNDNRVVKGSDLDASMIDLAQKKNAKNVSYKVHDMRKISEKDPVDSIYIIGNSLVHASSIKEVKKMLKRYNKMLVPGGTLIIQIVNYERVLSKGITTLPLIHKDKLSFYREYYFDKHNKMVFQTILQEKKEHIINHIRLLPLTKPTLHKILRESNYTNMKWFGSYDETPYDKDHSFHAIVVCQKE